MHCPYRGAPTTQLHILWISKCSRPILPKFSHCKTRKSEIHIFICYHRSCTCCTIFGENLKLCGPKTKTLDEGFQRIHHQKKKWNSILFLGTAFYHLHNYWNCYIITKVTGFFLNIFKTVDVLYMYWSVNSHN